MFELVALAVVACLIAGFVLERNIRGPTILTLLLTAVLSGVDAPVLEQIGVAIRRGCILLLAILVLRNRSRRPLPLNLLMAVSVLGIAGAIGARNPATRLEVAVGLFILHGPTATVIVGWIHERANAKRLAHICQWIAVIHVVLGAIALRTFAGGHRFAGVGTDAPLYAITGATLMSILLWALVYEKGAYRKIAMLLLPAMVTLTLLSGQRLAFILAASAGLPFILVALMRWPLKALQAAIVSMLSLAIVIRHTELLDFAIGRLGTIDTNGRQDRWSMAQVLFAERPFVGWGAGFRTELNFGVHNSFVSIALETGLIGLALWVAALSITGIQCLRNLRDASSDEGLNLLALSWLLVSIAGAMVEDKLYRPTNLPAIVLVLTIGLVFALRVPPKQEGMAMAKTPPGSRSRLTKGTGGRPLQSESAWIHNQAVSDHAGPPPCARPPRAQIPTQ